MATTFIITDLQAVEPEFLAQCEGIIVTVDQEADGMGWPTVMVASENRDALVSYCKSQWPEDDEWFAEYVVGRISTLPTSYEALAGFWAKDDPRKAWFTVSPFGDESVFTVSGERYAVSRTLRSAIGFCRHNQKRYDGVMDTSDFWTEVWVSDSKADALADTGGPSTHCVGWVTADGVYHGGIPAVDGTSGQLLS